MPILPIRESHRQKLAHIAGLAAMGVRNLLSLKGLHAVNISSYEDLLNAANAQAEPQRLLFVFAGAELPDDCTAGQKEQFQARKGGALSPVMCVDKLAGERGSFAGLVEESRQTGASWDVVFVACMPVQSDAAPDGDETGQAFRVMIKSIQDGKIGNFLAFSPEGALLQLVAS